MAPGAHRRSGRPARRRLPRGGARGSRRAVPLRGPPRGAPAARQLPLPGALRPRHRAGPRGSERRPRARPSTGLRGHHRGDPLRLRLQLPPGLPRARRAAGAPGLPRVRHRAARSADGGRAGRGDRPRQRGRDLPQRGRLRRRGRGPLPGLRRSPLPQDHPRLDGRDPVHPVRSHGVGRHARGPPPGRLHRGRAYPGSGRGGDRHRRGASRLPARRVARGRGGPRARRAEPRRGRSPGAHPDGARRGLARTWPPRAASRSTAWPGAVSWAADPHDPHRHLRLQLSRVAGHLLSGEVPDRQDAPLLRGAVLHRRDQLHVLSHAQRQDGGGLGRGDAG